MADFEPQARGGKGVKCMPFQKNGANGTRLVCALSVREPFDFFAVQKMSPATRLNTDIVDIELKSGKGLPLLMAIAGDDLEKIIPSR